MSRGYGRVQLAIITLLFGWKAEPPTAGALAVGLDIDEVFKPRHESSADADVDRVQQESVRRALRALLRDGVVEREERVRDDRRREMAYRLSARMLDALRRSG